MAKHQVKVRFAQQIRTVGTKIQAIRVQKGMSQEYLANVAKISKNSVVIIESGELNPSLGTLCAIAYGLNVPLTDLFTSVQISGEH